MTTTMATHSAAEYYSSPGPFTDLANHAGRMSELPGGVADLCRVVQGLVVHPFFAQLYGLDPRALREDELQTRSASAMLDRILTLDPRPLSDARPPERRFVGNCRHFTTLLCAFLRARRVPARARCGFGAYFGPVNFEDHWVCEVRDEARGTWRLVDAQLDPAQIELLHIPFDPRDVPRTQFLVAGDAWQRYRRGSADPQRFGIHDLRGSWFILQNLIRDLAARAKRELLPWDGWGLMLERERYDDPAVLALLDRIAEMTQAGDERHREILDLYESEPTLRVPRVIVNFATGGNTVDLGARAGD